jgi:hypothetical protein
MRVIKQKKGVALIFSFLEKNFRQFEKNKKG